MNSNLQTTEWSAQRAYDQFWPKANEEMKNLDSSSLKHQELPLARIKKIMKLDEDVKMISAEAPVLFSKAAEMFIHELTMRAWIHTEDNKRRTLQRNDIAMAIAKYDQFDFLIDIVPREEVKPSTSSSKRQESSSDAGSGVMREVYYVSSTAGSTQTTSSASTSTTTSAMGGSSQQQPQIIQLQPQQMVSSLAPPPGGIQIVQQIVTPSGEIQQIPIQLTSQQLQLIKSQMTGMYFTSFFPVFNSLLDSDLLIDISTNHSKTKNSRRHKPAVIFDR